MTENLTTLWYRVAHQIFQELDQKGILGQGFPAGRNPYYLNDTPAGLLLDITKEEAEQLGFMRRDQDSAIDIPEGLHIATLQELEAWTYWQDTIRHIDPQIESTAVLDPGEGVFKIMPQERDFLVKHSLPVPTKHWLKRMQSGLRVCSGLME